MASMDFLRPTPILGVACRAQLSPFRPDGGFRPLAEAVGGSPMRVLSMLGMALACGATTLGAQRSHRIELGGFGTYTRYDPIFGLERQFGGGGRLGFFLTNNIGLEVDGSVTKAAPTAGGPTTQVRFGSVSLVLSTGGTYLLGGYSRLEMGVNPPYNFSLNAVHGGLGQRLFLTDRVALRIEARAYYPPNNPYFAGKKSLDATASAGLSVFLLGGGPHEAAPRPLPPAQRESVVVAAGRPPAPAVAPTPTPAFAPAPAPALAPAPTPAVERRTPAVHFVGEGGHADQFEFGAFGSYTRYDRAYNLKNQVGGGGRLALFISDKVSIEVEGGFQRPTQKLGTLSPQLVLGSVSLVFNAPAGRNLFYLLGGYTRFTFRDTLPPYDFTDNALHGAIGDRFFLTDHLALRVEGRAVWSPTTNLPGGKLGGQIIGTAGLSYFTAKGRLAQARAIGWQHQWFWGGQGGVLIYKTNRQPLTYDPIIGGHWLITGKRTALYTAFEQAFFVSPVVADVAIPNTDFVGTFSFSNVRRIMGGVLAFPTQQRIQPVTGGGFALMQILTPELQSCSGCFTKADTVAAFDAADANASKAFFWVMGGVDIRQGRLSIFGHYIITSAAKAFLLQGPTHTLQGGVRYSLGTAKEEVTQEH